MPYAHYRSIKADETSCMVQVTKVYVEGLILPFLKKKDGTRVTIGDFILPFQVRLPLSILRAHADSTTVRDSNYT
jgi:hypothetical protein